MPEYPDVETLLTEKVRYIVLTLKGIERYEEIIKSSLKLDKNRALICNDM